MDSEKNCKCSGNRFRYSTNMELISPFSPSRIHLQSAPTTTSGNTHGINTNALIIFFPNRMEFRKIANIMEITTVMLVTTTANMISFFKMIPKFSFANNFLKLESPVKWYSQLFKILKSVTLYQNP